MRSILLLVAAGTALAASEATVTEVEPVALPAVLTLQVDAAGVVDGRDLDAALPSAAWWRRLPVPVLVGQAPGDDALADGLALLAAEGGIPADVWQRRSRLRTPAAVQLTRVGGRRQPVDRVSAFIERYQALPQTPALALVGFGVDDISPGRRVETVANWPRVVMEIRHRKVSLGSLTTDTITTTTTQNGLTRRGAFPIELPNTEVVGISTTAAVPLGGLGVGRQQAAGPPRLSSRYPGLAFAWYRAGIDALRQDDSSAPLVLTTVPLARRGNMQRNAFNSLVRHYAADSGLPLWDVAALLARQADGGFDRDEQGPRLADRYCDQQFNDRLTEQAKRDLARSFVLLLQRQLGPADERG